MNGQKRNHPLAGNQGAGCDNALAGVVSVTTPVYTKNAQNARPNFPRTLQDVQTDALQRVFAALQDVKRAEESGDRQAFWDARRRYLLAQGVWYGLTRTGGDA